LAHELSIDEILMKPACLINAVLLTAFVSSVNADEVNNETLSRIVEDIDQAQTLFLANMAEKAVNSSYALPSRSPSMVYIPHKEARRCLGAFSSSDIYLDPRNIKYSVVPGKQVKRWTPIDGKVTKVSYWRVVD
jgi:hypothetical protein